MYCKKHIIFVLLILLTGCQATSVPINSAYTFADVKRLTKLTLNLPLIIPANKARVYLQAGTVVSDNDVDRYYPNCSLEIKTIKPSAQTIMLDTFEIIKVKNDEEMSGIKMIYASRGFAGAGDGPISHQNWVTHFYLQSSKQPDVFRLSCAHWEEPTEARHLTLAEINSALGKFITLK